MSRRDDSQHGGYARLYPLAKGGLGQVDLVVRREGSFERLYAMKRPHAHLLADGAFLAMFLAEARVAGLLRHANVASVLDVGEDDEGPYLVMDYVEGISLRQLVRSLGPGELLPVQVCLTIAAQVARGLHAAHDMSDHDGKRISLVHRDVSPANILLGFDGVVRVADFGIAKVLGAQSETTTGLLKGKIGYMSPEQLRFEAIDARSDLFALGVVLWEMLAGQRLFAMRTEPAEVAQRILRAPPPDISEHRRDVPPDLERLLLDLLAKDPAHRPSSAREVADSLDAIAIDVAADQGPLTLEGWLAERFATERDEHTARVSAALAGLARRPSDRSSEPVRPRLSRRWIVAAAGASFALAVSVAAVLALGPEPAADAEATALPPVAGAEPPADLRGDEAEVRDVAASPVPVADAPSAGDASVASRQTSTEEPPVVEETPPAPRRPRRRPPARRAAERPAPMETLSDGWWSR